MSRMVVPIPAPHRTGNVLGRLLRCDAVYYDAVAMSEPVESVIEASRAARETVAESDAGFLWDFWYPAVRSTEVKGNRLATAMLLEVPLVLGRTAEGQAFAMRDSCPHRGIPLSYGRFDGKNLECSYHGWRFEACSGQCVEIPSLTSQDKLKVERIFAGHYPCLERDGYFWVYMSAADRGCRRRFLPRRSWQHSAKNIGSRIWIAICRRTSTKGSLA
jgi:phenylpropionate dioxygenase-like ring-hydroxylating dioxygenase large terminal subunit